MGKGKWVVCLLFILLLVAGGTYWHMVYVKQLKEENEPLAKLSPCPYHNINQLRCEPDLAKKKKEYTVLRSDLNDYIEQQKKEQKVTDVALYFRDLQNGPIININEQIDFIPASLLKLPLLITYYKKAEDDPSLLGRKVKVEGDIGSLPQNIKPEQTAQIGRTYSIEELIALMITQSDNTSWKMLLNDLRKNYSEDDFITTLSDLGIVDPRKRNDQQYITVQGYASIFRILYNSSYLNLAMSDKALALLKHTEFKDGIVAGVPDDLQVAHKFGEQKNGTEQQLHDCGIVYYTPNPYIICIMTRGYDNEELKPVIKEISRKVYEEVRLRNEEEQTSK